METYKLLDTLKQRVWSTNVSIASKEDVNRAVLLDSGNLVLTNGIEIKWQSFDYPTDTWLPGARIGFDKSKNTLQKLTSWRNMNDPATGKYSLQLDQNQNGELVLLDNRGENWRSGPWDEGGVASLAERKGVFNFSYDPTKDSKYITFNVFGESVGGQCLLWNGDLFDLKRILNNSSQVELNLKLFESSNKGKKKPLLVALAASITSAIFVCGTCCYFLWRRNLREKGILRKKKFREMLLSESATNLAKPEHSSNKGQEKKSDIELKFFELHDLKVATDNFSLDNKLGEGGFGAVFKGQLPDGQQIAVKRLSTQSRQGISEFKTEALLIAKLQHRNLVRFFGCCVEDEEKMLIYEYMPNKSLDYFIFDESRKSLLDWKKRHEIIIGIARGILYLHQDSRLKIIHRDLKPSNILLDEDMNPKISDFGTARIFSGNQNEAKTLRVVGTYAYMSPEYALAGLFSVKSDVFSFGVMVLEVISGKKNRISHDSDSPPNLIRQAWELWNDGMAFELIDPTIVDSCTNEEVLRCIQIGLLCLHIDAAHRPTMSSILFMLSNEATVPSPKQPLITLTSKLNTTETTSSSINEVTITAPDVR
ncbi:g-type lectin s-receptor-like serinethreonine-protein kinase b120 [Nicotiana attenuata]|uniref:non-specific serine/threonine protein kinase n=1 Tax=Nicotiana attenuata TaxID=49451 RepID=A0A314LEA0_NICAT|nr:g-type lectin s-receptor-like serinethreonine-protein kinase b120 [Nicotiana attenuata]